MKLNIQCNYNCLWNSYLNNSYGFKFKTVNYFWLWIKLKNIYLMYTVERNPCYFYCKIKVRRIIQGTKNSVIHVHCYRIHFYWQILTKININCFNSVYSRTKSFENHKLSIKSPFIMFESNIYFKSLPYI